MADSAAFDRVSAALESATALSRLEARGTVRLALRRAGLDATTVTDPQILVVVHQVLPGELASRGIRDGDGICERIEAALSSQPNDEASSKDTPEAVFQRLGGNLSR